MRALGLRLEELAFIKLLEVPFTTRLCKIIGEMMSLQIAIVRGINTDSMSVFKLMVSDNTIFTCTYH